MATKLEGSRRRHRRARLDRRHSRARSSRDAGLKIVALERGAMRTHAEPIFRVPLIRDELRFVAASRPDAGHRSATPTRSATIRPQEALPMRRLGSFLPGEGVGGAGVHWNGDTWRWTDMELKDPHALRGALRQELHPGRHAAAGLGHQLRGARALLRQVRIHRRRSPARPAISAAQIQPGGNPFEAPRARDYPLPPLDRDLRRARCSAKPRDRARLPPVPAAVRQRVAALHQSGRHEARRVPVLRLLRALRLRGERQGQPAHHGDPGRARAIRMSSCAPIPGSRRCIQDSDGKKATGVAYTNVLTGEEIRAAGRSSCCSAPRPSTTCT